jgi:enamine deaminase RidA (YjgF/YER057c/UK114 family)
MTRRAINPAHMYNAVEFGFSHAVESTGNRIVHLAGQVAWDDAGTLVGANDLAAQCAQVFRNLTEVLAECHLTPADIVRLRTYVVDYSPDKLGVIGAAIGRFYGNAVPAANTLLGVSSLAMPEFLIEVEATAVSADR